ncbi:uncharacterized protein LOC116413162 [Galleria mellonella]|uniref:Uncharacterized protein LOC116413162 n=1 Tax=Galleria mellonella TaxID=7137 RepID=A0A6J3C698_GALME|nr:uncharacterized protein LOC116413162 [Galleria mellonella]
MIRITLTKLKSVCSPHILWNEPWINPSKVEKLSASVLSKRESTVSGNDEGECEKCKRIIELIFAPNKSDIDKATIEANALNHGLKQEQLTEIITHDENVNDETACEKCNRIINEVFAERKFESNSKKDITEHATYKPIDNIKLQSTTAKETEEKLAQKIEVIDEMPLVEAARPAIEGFSAPPKVLGNIVEAITVNYSANDLNSNDTKHTITSLISQDTLDELAKRCLDTPNSQIDDRILREMGNLGIPQTTNRESNIHTVDQEVMQMDILEKPVQNSEIELEIRVLEKNPVHATKTYSIFESNFDSEKKTTGRHVNILYPTQRDNVEEDCSHLEAEGSKDCNELEEIDTTSTRPNIKTLSNDKNSEKEGISFNDHNFSSISNKIFNCYVPPAEKTITLLHSMENNQTNSMVNYTSPDDYSELIKNLKAHEKLKAKRESIQKLEREGITPQNNPPTSSESDPTQIDPRYSCQHEDLHFLKRTTEECADIPLKQERIKPHHLKEEPLFIDKEFSSHTEPAIMIKECTETISSKEDGGDIINEEKLLPHHLLSELSILPRDIKLVPQTEVNDSCESEDYTMKLERTQPHYLRDNPIVTSKEFSPFTAPSILIKEDIHLQVTETSPYKLHLEYNTGKNYQKYFVNNKDIISDKNAPEKVAPPTKESKERDYFDTTPMPEDNGILVDSYNKRSMAFAKGNHVCDTLAPGKIENEIKQPVTPSCKHSDDAMINIMSSSEMRHITENEYSEPVICAETRRLSGFESNINEPLERNQTHEQLLCTTVQPESLVKSGSDKENMKSNKSEVQEIGAKPELKLDTDQISMKELLKRVRERNRLEFCRDFVLKTEATQVEPFYGKCRQPKKPCPPPAPVCPPKDPCPPPLCPPPEPPCPKPCKPVCPDPCAPAKPSCPPPKKSPCGRFKKQKFKQISDTLTVLFSLGPKLSIPHYKNTTISNKSSESSKSLVTKDIITKLNSLGIFLQADYLQGQFDAFENESMKSPDITSKYVIYVRGYEPWVPIPSWLIPEKEKKQKFVCPKEGCKQIPPPRLSQPCKENPCANLPKRSFSIIDVISREIGKKYIFDVKNL